MLSIFESKKTKLQKDQIKNLIALAKIDGVLAGAEREFLYKAGKKNNIKEDEIDDLISETYTTTYHIPTNDSDRFDHLFEMVQVMMADGVIEESEMDYCIIMAERLGFKKAIIGILVRKISLGLTDGKSRESIKEESRNFLTI